MKISTNIVTVDEYGSFRELNEDEIQKALALCFTIALDRSNRGRLLYRGVSKDYLSDRLVKEHEEPIESTILTRLFFFGEKAAHFRKSLKERQIREYLTDINDISESTCNKIFDLLNKLRKSKDPAIKVFLENHELFFNFFLDKTNKPEFYYMIQKLGVEARDYYLGFLHTAGRIYGGERSVSISTSLSYDQAEYFSGKKEQDRYVIISVKRYLDRKNQLSPLLTKINELGIPTLPQNSRIFEGQKEETLRSGIFPHDIIGVNCIHDDKFVINPHVFSDRNSMVNIMISPLDIDQREFSRKLAKQTNYSSYFYTFDRVDLYEKCTGNEF
ncbi:hypothetical protein ACXLRA_004313 [Vibrio vulnificus]|nr:hypothetical protein [Vibrio vulnificus]